MVKRTKKSSVHRLIKAIAIIDYIYGALFLIVGIKLFFGGTFLSYSNHFFNTFWFISMLGIFAGGALLFMSFLVLAIGILYISVARSLTRYEQWANVTQIILVVPGLFSFPIGTAIGMFILWVLLINKDTKKLFK